MLFAEWIMTSLSENGVFWFVSLFCVVAAYIDGTQLKVPNAITFPMIIAGWLYSSVAYGMAGDGWYMGLLWSIGGTAVGLACLYPFYAIGGMGGGDVKMLAAVGAWVHSSITISAFFLSAFIGGLMAVLMIVFSKSASKHYYQFFGILNEIVVVKDPEKLSEIAAARKHTMHLLPYGIPIAIGTILHFAWIGRLF
jgi:prepilin peptidase CpaA